MQSTFSQEIQDFYWSALKGQTLALLGSLGFNKLVSAGFGKLGEGVASLTFDDVYQTDRANEQKARTAEEGFSQGISRFGSSLVEGLTGVITQPIKAHQRERTVESVFKGFGMGLAGIFTKPVTGVADLIAKTAEGIANDGVYEQSHVKRMRPPRYFDEMGVVRAYDPVKSEGQTILFCMESGIYQEHLYRFHIRCAQRLILMLTNQALMMIKPGSFEGEYITDRFIPVQRLHAPLVPNIDCLLVYYKNERGQPNQVLKIIPNHKNDVQTIFNELVRYCHTPAFQEPSFQRTKSSALMPKPETQSSKKGVLDYRESIIPLIGEFFAAYLCAANNGDFLFCPQNDLSQGRRFNLRECQVFQRGNSFVLTYHNDTYHFRCTSFKEALEWIDVITLNGASK